MVCSFLARYSSFWHVSALPGSMAALQNTRVAHNHADDENELPQFILHKMVLQQHHVSLNRESRRWRMRVNVASASFVKAASSRFSQQRGKLPRLRAALVIKTGSSRSSCRTCAGGGISNWSFPG